MMYPIIARNPRPQDAIPIMGPRRQPTMPTFSTWTVPGIAPAAPSCGPNEAFAFHEELVNPQQKRCRNGGRNSFEQYQEQHHQPVVHPFQQSIQEIPSEDEVSQSSVGKRSRPNNYRAPREVKSSLVSVMGSLVGGGACESNIQVRLRRELSASHLDQFMSSDAMDEDIPEHRERSMSF